MSDALAEDNERFPRPLEALPTGDVVKIAAGLGELGVAEALTPPIMPLSVSTEPGYLRQHLVRLLNDTKLSDQRRADLRQRGLQPMEVAILEGDYIRYGHSVQFPRHPRELLSHLICRYSLTTTLRDLWAAGYEAPKRPAAGKQPLAHELRRLEATVRESAAPIIRTFPALLTLRGKGEELTVGFDERVCLTDTRPAPEVTVKSLSITEQVQQYVRGEAPLPTLPTDARLRREFMQALSAEVPPSRQRDPETDAKRARIQQAQAQINGSILTKPVRVGRPRLPK